MQLACILHMKNNWKSSTSIRIFIITECDSKLSEWWIDKLINGQMDELMDRQINIWTNGWIFSPSR